MKRYITRIKEALATSTLIALPLEAIIIRGKEIKLNGFLKDWGIPI